MVDQQEFHRRFLRGDSVGRPGEDFHALGHRLCARRDRLWRTFDINEAHAAIRGDGELAVVAKPRDVGFELISHLDDHLARTCFDRFAVDLDVPSRKVDLLQEELRVAAVAPDGVANEALRVAFERLDRDPGGGEHHAVAVTRDG